MVKNKAGIYQFSSFLKYKNVVHGFSTRSFSSFRRESVEHAMPRLVAVFNISQKDITYMEQVHGNKVSGVSKADITTFIPQSDGLVSKEKSCFLCIRTADCVPIMAFDPGTNMCGVAHAGWKGALSNIATELVERMADLGSKISEIRIGIGPSIRVCCYAIDKHRATHFITVFPAVADTILEERKGVTYLNLQKLVMTQLQSIGVQKEHIEDGGICTHDKSDEFFSYRDKKSQPGLFAGIIGMA